MIRSQHKRPALLLWPLALALITSAHAEILEESGKVRVIASDIYGKRVVHEALVTTFFDPATPAPRPVALLNHGRPGNPQERAAMGRVRYETIARWFAETGFLVVIPTRVGYGDTAGEDLEYSGSCGATRYERAVSAAAQQSLQILDSLRPNAEADLDRVLVVGQSFGGTTAVALAAQGLPGVKAALNFSGGMGGDPNVNPGQPCDPYSLSRMFENFGKTSRIPTLWLYSENDRYWGPQLPREWFHRFREAGGVGEFATIAFYGRDGHGLFHATPHAWQPRVFEFLLTHVPQMLEAKK